MNPRNGKAINLGEARAAEAERLQNELEQTERTLGAVLSQATIEPRTSGLRSAMARLFGRNSHPIDRQPAERAQQILAETRYPAIFPKKAICLWLPDSQMVAIEYTLPPPEAVPSTARYRYVKSKAQIVATPKPAREVREAYALLVARVMLRSMRDLFAGLGHEVQAIALNGYVETVDLATGQDVRPAIASIRVTRGQTEAIDFARADPIACLRALGAVISSSPSALVPVRPMLDLSMIDKRFVGTDDVISSLGDQYDLMELTPNEFEHLITNLFEKMGLETRQTQASRDGGVDCVAFNHDPVLGGKVVIQAKRYRNTVGVSAVRDLYGTVQNEGASKGILVTTSGYGPAAYEFAKNKPIELFEGSHLLYLLKQHAGIDATVRL